MNSDIEVLDLKTMVSTRIPGSEGFFGPRMSPDGKYIVTTTDEDERLMLYDLAKKQWRTLAIVERANVGWPAFSHDSKFVYATGNNKIFRINIADGKVETVVSVSGIRWTSFALDWYGWFDLTPDDRIMILRDTGSEEIYALQLEY